MDPAMPDVLAEIDNRNRISLSRVKNLHERYFIREESDGTVILEPAIVMTAAERAYLADPELQNIVDTARAHPENRKPRPRRPNTD